MNRRRQRTRRNTVTRSYPVYSISGSQFTDDDDSIIEIKPIKQHRRHRKHRSKVESQDRTTISPVLTDDRKRRSRRVEPQRAQVSATMQTEEIPTVSAVLKNEEVQPEKKPSAASKHRCLRIFTLILAIFLLIISLLLLAFSLNLLVNPNITKIRSVAIMYPQALPSSTFSGTGPTDTLLVAAIIGIILSSLTLIISIMAIICLICIKSRFYKCFFCSGPVLLLILFLLLLGLALFVMIQGDTELQRLAYSTQMTVSYYYNSTNTSLVRNGWDFVQYYFGCCGVKTNNTDWLSTPSGGWKYNSQLPRSCCGYDPNDAGHAGRIFVASDVPSLVGYCYYSTIGQPTCYDSIKTNLLITVLVFLISLALIVLALGILLMVILFIYRTIHHRVEDSIKK